MTDEMLKLDALTIDASLFTPMMQQYIAKKREYEDEILFFRLGDFYEMFFQDALLVARELEIALTARDAGYVCKVPMCGVPHHASLNYIERLIEKGYKIAICEQTTEPVAGKIVERDVVKIFTPGNFTLEVSKTNDAFFTAALIRDNKSYLLAYCDVSLGYISGYETSSLEEMRSFISSINIVELITDLENVSNNILISKGRIFPQTRTVYEHLYNAELNPLALDLLLSYFIQTNKSELTHLQPIVKFIKQETLVLDAHTKNHLEIVKTQRFGTKQGSLFSEIDATKTAIGSRLLKSYFDAPLQNAEEITFRQQFAISLYSNYNALVQIRKLLQRVYDIDRITSKIGFQTVNPRDLLQLCQSLKVIPEIITNGAEVEAIRYFFEEVDVLSDVSKILEYSILEDAPISIKDGGVINPAYDDSLSKYVDTKDKSQQWLLTYEQEIRDQTGIKNIKIGYNRNFGYYIEVTKSNIAQMNTVVGFERRQTLTNAERFTTPKLKELEIDITRSEELALVRETEIFNEIKVLLQSHINRLQALSKAIAFLDVMCSNALLLEQNYTRAEITENQFEIIGLRHVVIEKLLGSGRFITNDLSLSEKDISIITGPNMAGKSTYLRSVAHAVILNQIGAFVPASSAVLPLFDRIFTRIGSSDDVLSGQSTFMVEMSEVNVALKNATSSSLILFDEIGRGTATYDGLALAQSIIEYIHNKIHAKMIFATHYHELVSLEDSLHRLQNVHVSASEEKGGLKFHHKVLPGAVDKSYGIHVAGLAKLPRSVITRSTVLLKSFEEQGKSKQLNLFQAIEEDVVDTDYRDELTDIVNEIDINEMTPIDAFNKLIELVEMAKKK